MHSNRLRRLLYFAIALTTTTVSLGSNSQRVDANPATAASVVIGCLSNSSCVLGVVTIGSALYWQITHNGNPVLIPLTPIIDDPDREPVREWDYIWADSEQEAIRKCQAFAEGNRVRYVKVKKVGRKRYECHWEF